MLSPRLPGRPPSPHAHPRCIVFHIHTQKKGESTSETILPMVSPEYSSPKHCKLHPRLKILSFQVPGDSKPEVRGQALPSHPFP